MQRQKKPQQESLSVCDNQDDLNKYIDFLKKIKEPPRVMLPDQHSAKLTKNVNDHLDLKSKIEIKTRFDFIHLMCTFASFEFTTAKVAKVLSLIGYKDNGGNTNLLIKRLLGGITFVQLVNIQPHIQKEVPGLVVPLFTQDKIKDKDKAQNDKYVKLIESLKQKKELPKNVKKHVQLSENRDDIKTPYDLFIFMIDFVKDGYTTKDLRQKFKCKSCKVSSFYKCIGMNLREITRDLVHIETALKGVDLRLEVPTESVETTSTTTATTTTTPTASTSINRNQGRKRKREEASTMTDADESFANPESGHESEKEEKRPAKRIRSSTSSTSFIYQQIAQQQPPATNTNDLNGEELTGAAMLLAAAERVDAEPLCMPSTTTTTTTQRTPVDAEPEQGNKMSLSFLTNQ